MGCLVSPPGLALNRITLDGKFAGFIECRKQFLEFSRQLGVARTESGLVCFLFSLPLLLSAIPYIKYNSSTFVGLRHPVIARHAILSSASILYACADLAHTGAAYSATDLLDVVLSVLRLAPYLELHNVLRRLLRVTIFIFVSWM